jgi:hypothetical protein
MVEYVRGYGLAPGGCFGQRVGLLILGAVHVLQGEAFELSLEAVDSCEVLHKCGVLRCVIFLNLADNYLGVCSDYAGSNAKCP